MTKETPNGFCFRVEVRQTADKGLGVFSAEAIKRDSIVWRHVPGNYTVHNELSFKAALAQLSKEQIVYELTHMFGLRGIPDCVIRVHDAGALINHANPPNLATNESAPLDSVPGADTDHHIRSVIAGLLDDRYALAATRDIEPGEELTTDYSAECHEPAWFNAVYDEHGVVESYTDV